MKWDLSSAERFMEHQEYIDTAIVPVVKIELGSAFKKSIAEATWLTGVANSIEKELTGRVMLFPAYTFVPTEELNELGKRIQTQLIYFQEDHFKHVVFLITGQEKLPSMAKDATILSTDLPDENSHDFSEEDLESAAQKLVSKLINMWQK